MNSSGSNKIHYVARFASLSEDEVPCVILDPNGRDYGATANIRDVDFISLYVKRIPKAELPDNVRTLSQSLIVDPMKDNDLIRVLLNQDGVFDIPFEDNKWLIKFHAQDAPSIIVGLISDNKNKTLGLLMSLASVLSENDCAVGGF